MAVATCAPIAKATFASQAVGAASTLTVVWSAPSAANQDDLGIDTVSNTARVTLGSNVALGSGVFLVIAEVDYANQTTAAVNLGTTLQRKNAAGAVQDTMVCRTLAPISAASAHSDVLPLLCGGVTAGDYFEVLAGTTGAAGISVSGQLYIYRLPLGTAWSKIAIPSQTVASGAAVTLSCVGGTVTKDDVGVYNPAFGTSGLSFPVAGSYLVTCTIDFDANATGRRLLSMQQGAATTAQARSTYERSAAAAGTADLSGAMAADRVAAADGLALAAQQNSGGNRTVVGTVYVARLPVSRTVTFVSTQPTQSTVASNTEALTTVAVTSSASPVDNQGMIAVGQQTRATFVQPGQYLVTTDWESLDTNTTGYRRCVIYHRDSGGTLKNSWTVACRAPIAATFEVRQSPFGLLPNVVAGDYLEFGYTQDSGTAALSFEGVRFVVVRLGPSSA